MTPPIGRRLLTVLAASLLVTGAAWGRLRFDDEPLASSRNGKFYAEVGPGKGSARSRTTQVFRWVAPRKAEMIWEKPGSEDATYLSDDGEYLVSGQHCEIGLPPNYGPDFVIATFYHRSAPVHSVRARDVILESQRLRKSNGYTMWGQCMGFLGDPKSGNRFAIDTEERRRLVYDVTTGKLLEVLPAGPIPNRN